MMVLSTINAASDKVRLSEDAKIADERNIRNCNLCVAFKLISTGLIDVREKPEINFDTTSRILIKMMYRFFEK